MALATSTIVALALAAAASGATYYNTQQTAKHADNVAAEGIRDQAANQRKNNARVQKELTDLSGSSLEKSANAKSGEYLAQVQRELAQANAGLGEQGISKEFDQRAGGAAAANADWGAVGAKLLGTIDGANAQRDNEAKLYGDAGMDLAVLGEKVKSDDFLNRLKQGGVRRNAKIDLLAGLLGGAAQGAASYQGGTTGTSASAPASYGSSVGDSSFAFGGSYNPYGTGHRGSLNGY